MKEFWRENSKLVSKLILNQFGATFFGIMMMIATAMARDELVLFTSCFATLFYLFLLYTVIWERGGQDRIKVDGGRAVRRPLTGLYASLLAGIPNIIIAILVLVSNPFKASYAWAGTMNVVGRSAALLWQGMYSGIVQYFSPSNPIIHLLTVFPAVIVCTAGYWIGFSNKRILALFERKKSKK